MATDIKQFEDLSEEERAEFFAEEETVAFVVERTLGNGSVVSKTFVLVVEPNNVDSSHLAKYRRAVAECAVKADEVRERAGENVTTVNEIELRNELFEASDAFIAAEAQLLAKLVLSCDYPRKDFSKPETLTERVGAGPAARLALHDYFFGSSDEPEVETGTTPTPSTETPLDSAEATVSEEVTPATS